MKFSQEPPLSAIRNWEEIAEDRNGLAIAKLSYYGCKRASRSVVHVTKRSRCRASNSNILSAHFCRSTKDRLPRSVFSQFLLAVTLHVSSCQSPFVNITRQRESKLDRYHTQGSGIYCSTWNGPCLCKDVKRLQRALPYSFGYFLSHDTFRAVGCW